MYKIVLTVMLAILTSCTYAQSSNVRTQTSHGNCSPNAGYIINSTVICFERKLTPEEQKLFYEIRGTLEQIAKEGGPVQQKIIIRLNSIASQSHNKFSELFSLYQEINKNISDIKPSLLRIESITSETLAQVQAISSPSITFNTDQKLDSKVNLSHLSLTKKDKSLAAVIADSQCKSLKFSKELEIKYLEVMTLIAFSESIDCKEKQYWYDIMPSMTSSQLARLLNIFKTEQQQLEELNIKYQAEIRCLNDRHLFEWTRTKNREDSNRVGEFSMRQFEIVVGSMETGCFSGKKEADEINFAINKLIATDPIVLASDPERAYLLSRVFSLTKYKNPEKRMALLKLAHDKNQDEWNYFADLARLFIDKEDWEQLFALTKRVLLRNRMPELYANSERDIDRKLMIYRWYLYSATRLGEKIDIRNAAVAGYNLTKLLLEREPNLSRLHNIIFFSGHIWQSTKIDPELKYEYFDSIYDAAERLRMASNINNTEYSGVMLSLSWYCLIAKAPRCAKKAALAGLEIDKNDTRLYTNLAHAYLILGEGKEAYKIYGKFVGQKIDGRLWEDIIIDDFQLLRKSGVYIVENPNDRSIFSRY